MLQFIVNYQENNILLRNFLIQRGVSSSLSRSVKTHGGFFCNGEPIKTNQHVFSADVIEFNLPSNGENENTVTPQDLPLNIIFEDKHAIVLNKPAGITVHPTLGYPDSTLANAFCGEMAKRKTPKAFRPIHRIDKNTSGIVLCAMNEYSACLLANNVQKEYYAIVEGVLEDCGEINAPIGLEENSFIKRAIKSEGKKALTKYKTLWHNDIISYVAVKPVTGRTHQIRVHFAHLGHPLLGDDLYGGDTSLINRHALHCGKVVFDDISQKFGARVAGEDIKIMEYAEKGEPSSTKTITCSLPNDMQSLLPTGIFYK